MIGFLSPGGRVALFVLGFLLAQKRPNANTTVGVVQIFDKLIALTLQLRVQAAAIRVAEQLLDAGQCVGGACIELFAQIQSLLQGVAVARLRTALFVATALVTLAAGRCRVLNQRWCCWCCWYC